MKKAIILFVCIGTMLCSFAQEAPSETSKPVLTKQEYLHKSKSQRTVAIVMVSVGGVMTLAGLAVAIKHATSQDYESTENLGTGLIIVGGAAMLGGIGLFVLAHKNKKMAMSVSFKNEPASLLQRSMVFNRSVPSLSLKISL